MAKRVWQVGAFALLAPAIVVLVGCGPGAPDAAQTKPTAGQAALAKGDGKAIPKVDDHSEWWCGEHGIPEDECSQCSSKLAKAMQAKGDWCAKHDRAQSQCFVCDPTLKDKYAAKYRAKYGKEPPPVEAEKDDKK